MTETVFEEEAVPAARPSLSGSFGVPEDVVWSRIESWVTHRWGQRTVTWIVRGPGTWQPRLKPTTIDTAEIWDGDAWESVTLKPGPLGYELDARVYRITTTVGSTETPPEAVLIAAARLAEFMDAAAADPAKGHTRVSDGDFSFDRPATWAARAIHLSGAADLLRGFR